MSSESPNRQSTSRAPAGGNPISGEPLSGKSCTPCRGGIPPLPPEAVARLLAETPGWHASADARRIERDYRFTDFAQALAFATRAGALAEAEFHHPLHITFGWGFASVALATKKIKGLHENDFILAAKLDRIAAALAAP
jgi:4a-hydroxytetrahydrobiopterin dehydratase